MAVREFTDSEGAVWRVWDVTPSQMHPVTRVEDYMTDLADGWLCFESAHEKRRLPAPYPRGWSTFTLPELEELCRGAPLAPLRRERISPLSGTPAVEVLRAEAADSIDREIVAAGERTFVSPRGRQWTVRPHECLDAQGRQQIVLRFTGDDIVVDVCPLPDDWKELTREQYALLLLDANPPRRAGEGPRRRREDRDGQG